MSTVRMKGLIFSTALLVSMTGCESFLPEEYDADTLDTEMSILDARACELVTRPLILHDTTYVDTGDPDSVVIDTVIDIIQSVTLTAFTDSNTAYFDSLLLDTVEASEAQLSAAFDSVFARSDTIVADEAVALQHSNKAAPHYIWYSAGSSPTGEIVIYTNEFVYIDLVEPNGTVVQALWVDMDLALISGCTYLKENPVTKLEDPVPAIKTRHVFQTATESFLIRFTLPSSGTIRVALLDGE